MEEGGLSRLLRQRATGQSLKDSLAFQHAVCGKASVWESVRMTHSLSQHAGCVNHVSFNSNGNLLLSGSDDTRVGLWDLSQEPRLQTILSTRHTQNIFCTRFLPCTADNIVASCAGDGTICVKDVASGTSEVFRRHQDRVKKFVTEPGNPNLMISCGEDGLVYEFDRRVPASEARLLAVLWDQVSIKAEANSLCSPTHRPHLVGVAGNDGRLRLYDRRVPPGSTASEAPEARTLANVLVKPNCPSFAWPGNPITGIACTADGQHFAANLLNDCVYLLDVADLPGHSERQAATRPAPGRRRRRREAAEYSAALQNLPGLRQAMDWMDEHHRSARTPQPWHSLEPRSGGGRQAEQEPTAAEAFLAPALTQLHARTKSLLAEMMAERSLSMSELSEPESAMRFAKVAMALAPTMGRAHFSLAIAHQNMGSMEQALDSVNTALRYSWSAELDSLKARLLSQARRSEPAATTDQPAGQHHDDSAQQQPDSPAPHAACRDIIPTAAHASPPAPPSPEARRRITPSRIPPISPQPAFHGSAPPQPPAFNAAEVIAQHRRAFMEDGADIIMADSDPPMRRPPAPPASAAANGASQAQSGQSGLPEATAAHDARHDSREAGGVQLASTPTPTPTLQDSREVGGGQLASAPPPTLQEHTHQQPCQAIGEQAQEGIRERADSAHRQLGSSGNERPSAGAQPPPAEDASPGPRRAAEARNPGRRDIVQLLRRPNDVEYPGGAMLSLPPPRHGDVPAGAEPRLAESDWDDDEDGADYVALSGMESDESDVSMEEDDDDFHYPDWLMATDETSYDCMLFDWADGYRAAGIGPPASSSDSEDEVQAQADAQRDWHIRGFHAAVDHLDYSHLRSDSQPRCWSMCYGGHSNSETIKDVAFVGPNDEVVAAGSDNGCMFLWDRVSGRLLTAVKGDRSVVNCVAGHPHAPLLASCGIDNSVKLWAPQLSGRTRARHLLHLTTRLMGAEGLAREMLDA